MVFKTVKELLDFLNILDTSGEKGSSIKLFADGSGLVRKDYGSKTQAYFSNIHTAKFTIKTEIVVGEC